MKKKINSGVYEALVCFMAFCQHGIDIETYITAYNAGTISDWLIQLTYSYRIIED